MSLQQMLIAVGGTLNDATGGTITYSGDFQIHTFTSSGTFTVTRATISSTPVEVLVVAAGSDGNYGNANGSFIEPSPFGGDGGNGGSGGQVIASSSLTLASFVLNTGYSVTVGAVSAGSSVLAYNGGSFTAAGDYLGGGSGGSSDNSGGNGVTGTTSSITGTSVVYGSSGGGGGGGASLGGSGAGSGGNGGTNAGDGGSGGQTESSGLSGGSASSYGCGGGGGGGAGGSYDFLSPGGAYGTGSSGIVVVRFKYRNV